MKTPQSVLFQREKRIVIFEYWQKKKKKKRFVDYEKYWMSSVGVLHQKIGFLIVLVLFFREKKAAQFQIGALEERDDADDEKYWQSYPGVLPQKSEHVWDALIDGVEKYKYV